MAACCHAPPALFAALDLLAKRAQDQDSTVPHLTPRRIVAVGILLLALSGVGFAIVEAMHPITRDEYAAIVQAVDGRITGEISAEESARQLDALDLGLFGWILTRRAYRTYRLLVFGGALAGLALLAVGAIRARQRSVAPPPGS